MKAKTEFVLCIALHLVWRAVAGRPGKRWKRVTALLLILGWMLVWLSCLVAFGSMVYTVAAGFSDFSIFLLEIASSCMAVGGACLVLGIIAAVVHYEQLKMG